MTTVEGSLGISTGVSMMRCLARPLGRPLPGEKNAKVVKARDCLVDDVSKRIVGRHMARTPGNDPCDATQLVNGACSVHDTMPMHARRLTNG